MKLAIIGSRHIKDFDLELVVPKTVTCIISGGAAGIDTIARVYAQKHNIELIEFFPEYYLYGRSAPIIRNKLIAQEADAVLAIWDGVSKGTAFTISFAKKIGKPVTIIQGS